MTPSFMRHAAFFGPEDQHTPVSIIGAGAMGSFIALLLAKMGCTRFKLWDSDLVESHNLPNQTYDVEHIGMAKVDALTLVLQRFNPDVQVETYNRFFSSEKDRDNLSGIVIMSVDSMAARRDIGEAIRNNWSVDRAFETRIGFKYGEVNILDPLDPAKLNEWSNALRDDSEVPDGPCSEKICTTFVALVSAFIVEQVCAFLSSKRRNTTFNTKAKTYFELSDNVATYQF